MGNKCTSCQIKKLTKKPKKATTDHGNEKRYELPRISDSLLHLQSPHFTLRYLWQSNYSAPVEDVLSSSGVVLDVGCGFGAWLIDMAKEYKDTDFVGVGLCPDQFPFSQVPKNVTFTQANILNGISYHDDEFDFVRLCYFANSFASCEWEPAIKELIRVTKPGGWIEFIEPDLVPTNMGPKFTVLVETQNQIIGESSSITERLELILNSTNLLINIQQDSRSLTLGSSGGEIGIAYENSIKNYFNKHSSQYYKHLGITYEEYQDLLNDAIEEFKTRLVKVRFFRFWAQKIENNNV